MATVTVTIAQSASLSDAANLRGVYVTEIIMPAAWTAAGLTFQGSEDNSSFQDVYEKANEEEYDVDSSIVDADYRIKIPPADLLGDCYLKVRSGTSGSAVAQDAARTITLKTRGI